MRLPLINLLYLLCSINMTIKINSQPSPKKLNGLIQSTIPLNDGGKIIIPSHIKHIKLDIGLSYSAPMSQYWLTHEDNLMVFGFEPNPASVNSILAGATKQQPSHGAPLETKFIGTSFLLIPCALGLSEKPTVNFFVTREDCGCSSIYEPVSLKVEHIIQVPIFKLSDFFDIFPFDTHPVIDYIKIDAQGADLSIVKSAEDYLTERVVYITLEAEDSQYENTNNSSQDIEIYMKSIGFQRYMSSRTSDPTYFNPRFSNYVKNNTIKIYQRG